MAIRARTVFLAVLVVLVLVVVGGLTAIGWEVVLGPKARAVSDAPFEKSEARLARGRYLAEGPAACFHCHSEHDFTTPEYARIEAKKGAGWVMPIPELNHIASRNITQDTETGIGSWKDDEIARAIREGVSRDGSALFPLMPYLAFRNLDDEDVKSIVVYLRTIPAVRNTVPKRSLPGPLEYLVNTMPVPLVEPQPSHPASTPVERGRYIANMAECVACHTPADDKGQPLPGMDFAGGGMFHDPGQGGKEVFSANITQDADGIQHYDEAMFKETLRTGRVKGRVLNHIMPFENFKNITDEDIADLFAFIKTNKPVKHRVTNTDAPAPCALCGQSHGLGELNQKGK
jgi:mono/diheme cytochrome c family protein